LAVLLATLGIEAGGDIATGKLSIGCDATSRTALLPLLGKQPGLNGHDKFESDTSLTRNDYYIANGDNYSFNSTLFANMIKVADRVSGGNFDRNAMAAYRAQRYDESVQQVSGDPFQCPTKKNLLKPVYFRTQTSTLVHYLCFSMGPPRSSTSSSPAMALKALPTYKL